MDASAFIWTLWLCGQNGTKLWYLAQYMKIRLYVFIIEKQLCLL